MNKIIYLTGFMGSGKSTIGPILANTLGWDFYDLDKVIEKKTCKKVRQIFEQDGEDYFRRIETETLKEISCNERVIISLGGGTAASDENMQFLKQSGKLIYLKISMEAAYKRLKHKRDRPALKNSSDDFSEDELMNTINNLMKSRTAYYELADYSIDTDKNTVGRTVDRIVKLISEMNFDQGIN